MKWTIVPIFCLVLSLNAEAQTAKDYPKNVETVKLLEKVMGSWKLQRVVDEEQKNKATQNSRNSTGGEAGKENPNLGQNGMQMVELNRNARYKLNNATTSLDSGSYRINEQQGVLYMESDADDITPTEWNVTVKDNVLTLSGREGDATSRYKYIYTRQRAAQ